MAETGGEEREVVDNLGAALRMAVKGRLDEGEGQGEGRDGPGGTGIHRLPESVI